MRFSKAFFSAATLALVSTVACQKQDDTQLRAVTAERDALKTELETTRTNLTAAQQEAGKVGTLNTENQNLKHEIDTLNQRIAQLEAERASRLSQRAAPAPAVRRPATTSPSSGATNRVAPTPTPGNAQEMEALKNKLQGGSGSK